MVGRELTTTPETRLGLIVNPIAGMGGRVGLKGTDGEEALARALRLGAEPIASEHAANALKALAKILPSVMVETVSGAMGEEAAAEAQLPHNIVAKPRSSKTTPEDTARAATVLRDRNVPLMLFAGGDGTAADIFGSIGNSVPALGIPAGVKMFSGVFARGAEAAGKVAADFLSGKVGVMEAEVLDIDEEEYRRGFISPKLLGVLRVPASRYIQSGKQGSHIAEDESLALESIARYLTDESPPSSNWILGPGSTVAAISQILGFNKTLFGVDVLKSSQELIRDLNEGQLLDLSRSEPCLIVVSPIGGQGFLFGRGNQQLSSRVLRQVGLKNVRIVATRSKLASISGRRLLVDTGEAKLDAKLRGFVRVIVGYREEVVFPVE